MATAAGESKTLTRNIEASPLYNRDLAPAGPERRTWRPYNFATLWPSWKNNSHGVAICFAIFWAINLVVVLRGIEYIRFLQGVSAPILLGVGVLLLVWAYRSAGGFGPMLSARSKFASTSEFLK